jgi:hypothetical protein
MHSPASSPALGSGSVTVAGHQRMRELVHVLQAAGCTVGVFLQSGLSGEHCKSNIPFGLQAAGAG